MANNFLNLDELVGEKKLKLNGKEYLVQDISVKKLWSFYNQIEKLAESGTEEDQLLEAIKFFYELCPDAKKEKAFDDLTVTQTEAMIEFIVSDINTEKKATDDTKKK